MAARRVSDRRSLRCRRRESWPCASSFSGGESRRCKKFLYARSATERQPHRPERWLPLQLQAEKWTASTLEQDPFERVVHERRIAVEPCGIAIRCLAHFEEPRRHGGGERSSPGALRRVQGAEIACDALAVVSHG